MLKYVHQNIVKISLVNELDIVLAYKRAKQLTQLTGMAIPTQTKFATAVSEICRNVLEHVGEGTIKFSIGELERSMYIEALIIDFGRGIPNVEEILKRNVIATTGKGWGIANAKKLVDHFTIQSENNKGTKVYLLKKIPANHPPINKTIVQGWNEYFSHEMSISPYEEIKQQNIQILEVMEALQIKQMQTEHQMDEIKALHENVTALLKEREEANLLLQKMNKELEDFAYTVSHDLKAPLRNIEGITRLLKKFALSTGDEQVSLQFDMLSEQVQRMEKLITGILSYAKSGRQNLEQTSVNVATLLHEIKDTIMIPEGISIHIGQDMPMLHTEEIYLRQIFTNLLENAIKYHDKTEGNISISSQQKGSFFEFAVKDDGPGIDEEHHEKIFKMYYSLHTSGVKDSTGLGLSIIKKITSEKGGKVWVESKGRGSTFIFTWPAE
ncbi:GHKL domain-containing protein [Rhodocytophaga rosea]|uniref:histidine kinase n=1 Tax=Rhodocytophaga rosea TaxID=2704465 RepID=A0A6C0GFA1_9BACT|nr:ATP-binding protein [Rhodocytophaga rosea]QHT66597.1 GHKL domain-containing protein [Rhodocytophaga rosea]